MDPINLNLTNIRINLNKIKTCELEDKTQLSSFIYNVQTDLMNLNHFINCLDLKYKQTINSQEQYIINLEAENKQYKSDLEESIKECEQTRSNFNKRLEDLKIELLYPHLASLSNSTIQFDELAISTTIPKHMMPPIVTQIVKQVPISNPSVQLNNIKYIESVQRVFIDHTREMINDFIVPEMRDVKYNNISNKKIFGSNLIPDIIKIFFRKVANALYIKENDYAKTDEYFLNWSYDGIIKFKDHIVKINYNNDITYFTWNYKIGNKKVVIFITNSKDLSTLISKTMVVINKYIN